ncbi:hypothetical protein [Nonomuraea sp. NPDC049750]|uniref:hypothetical protein n=1 Tax=Nonomuraea sp. NPDC049750 TaxID=3154738 RepID=UPI0033D24543
MNWVLGPWQFPPHCTAPHVSAVQSRYEELAWNAPRGGEPDGRVMQWTCDCDEVFYELIALGGLRFIRRTALRAGKAVIHESERWSFHVANAMWSALISGHVR